MKRYIRNAQYTMDHDNKMEVMGWLDFAESKIAQFCKEHSAGEYYYEVDDVSWGTDCFSIPIFRGSNSDPRNRKLFGEFRFGYDPEDVYHRDAEEQVEEKVDDFIDDLGSYFDENGI